MLLNELIGTKLITIQEKLNPAIWINKTMKPDIQETLLEISQAFVDFVGVDLDIQDITLTGSNANYTWTKHSDIDVHVIVPGTPTDEERELYNAKKALWASQHDITVKGMPVECYIQGSDEPHHSSGVYSILNDEWENTPSLRKPSINDSNIRIKTDAIMHAIEAALLEKNLNKLVRIKKKIVKMRKAGLDKSGEWSTENLVFKILRNLGMIDQISEKIIELEDAELSLEQIDA